jgi:hypothetical protein
MTRESAWRRTTRGYFVLSTIPDSTAQRILDIAPLIPTGGALAGWAAAYVSGVDVLDGLDPFTLARQPLPIHLGHDLGRMSLPQVRYVRQRLPATDRQICYGLSVTTPLRTAFDGGRWAPNLVEAVVFLDQVAHARRLDVAQLDQWCTPGARWPGVKQLRRALLLADSASVSPWETRLRVFYRLEACNGRLRGSGGPYRPPKPANRGEPYSLVANAASKDAAGGVMALRPRMNSRASGAPANRSMPASSHSMEMGPV